MTVIPPPGPHGGDGAAIARALGFDPAEMIDLSTTLDPLAPDPTPILGRHLDSVRRYPDPTTATRALADVIGVPVGRLLLTNGGAEAIDLVGRVLGGHVDEPEFGLYPRGDAGGPRWRSNPNSPLGHLADPPDPPDPDGEPPTVWDEAFWPLATGTWSRRDDLRGDVIVGSLTKLLACPGLRAGYLIVPEGEFGRNLLDRVRALRAGWPVSTLLCEALPDLLDTVDLPDRAARLRRHRRLVETEFGDRGLEIVGGGPTWLLLRNSSLRDRLAPHHIVVRDCASFGLRDTVRIGLPRPADLAAVLAAFDLVSPHPAPSTPRTEP